MAVQEQSGFESGAIDIEAIKQAVKAAPASAPPGPDAAAVRGKLLALRRSAAEQLEPLVEELAAAQAAKPVIADYNRKRRELLKSVKAELDEEMSALASSRSHAMAARRKALDLLAASDPLFAPVFLTLKPFLIWASPSNMLVDSHIDALAFSWAKLSRSHEVDYWDPGFPAAQFDYLWNDRLTFYYLWENPSTQHVVLNAKCSMVFNGVCVAAADTGLIYGHTTGLGCHVKLIPVEWWNQPPTDAHLQQQSSSSVFIIQAESGGIWTLETGELAVKWLSAVTREVRYDLFVVPPGAVAMFRAEVLFAYELADGHVGIDFATQPSYSISSLFQLELLTTPALASQA
jgi:hypothetical protein